MHNEILVCVIMKVSSWRREIAMSLHRGEEGLMSDTLFFLVSSICIDLDALIRFDLRNLSSRTLYSQYIFWQNIDRVKNNPLSWLNIRSNNYNWIKCHKHDCTQLNWFPITAANITVPFNFNFKYTLQKYSYPRILITDCLFFSQVPGRMRRACTKGTNNAH